MLPVSEDCEPTRRMWSVALNSTLPAFRALRDRLRAAKGDAKIESAQQWIASNYHKADVVGGLVRQCGLPKRTFDRRFRTATGYSPLAYIQALRIEEAKQLLETTDIAVETIGREVGYEDAASFRRLFRRYAGIGPVEYRSKLQPPGMVMKFDRGGQGSKAPYS